LLGGIVLKGMRRRVSIVELVSRRSVTGVRIEQSFYRCIAAPTRWWTDIILSGGSLRSSTERDVEQGYGGGKALRMSQGDLVDSGTVSPVGVLYGAVSRNGGPASSDGRASESTGHP
jgi:hypothetical protein